MGKLKILKNNQVFPDSNLLNLTCKWGITSAELNEAILETGSLDEKQIRKFLLKKGILFSFFGMFYYSINSLKINLNFKSYRSKKRNSKMGFSGKIRYMTIHYN